jgi:hypothetical protein
VPRRSRLVVLLVTFALVAACGTESRGPTARPVAVDGGWTEGPPAREALTEVAVAAHDGRIWVAGGMGPDGAPVTTVQVLDPATGVWDLAPPVPEPVHHSALVSDGDALYLIGGYGFDGAPRAAVHQLAGDGWTETAPLPEARGAGAATWDGAGRIVYAGGVGPDGVSDEAWAQTDHGWEPYGRLPEPLEHLAATSDGAGSVFVMGGRRGGLDTNSARVTVLGAGGGRALGEVPTRRGGVAAFWWPALGACLVGGESPGGTHAEVECLAPDGSLTSLPDLGRPRHGLGAAVVEGRAYVLLGGEQPGLFVSDLVEVLELP